MRKWIYEDTTPGLDKGISWDELYKSQKKKSKQKGISMLQGDWANGKNCSNFLPDPAGSIDMFNHMMGNSSNTSSNDTVSNTTTSSDVGGNVGECLNRLVNKNSKVLEYYDSPDDSYRWENLYDLDESGIGTFTAYFTAVQNGQDVDIESTGLDTTDDYGYLYADDDNVVFNDDYRDIRVNIADVDTFIDDVLYACDSIFEPGQYKVSGKFEYYLDGYINTSNSEYNQIDASFSIKDASIKRVD